MLESMKPTDVLRREHRVIELVLYSLERLITRFETERTMARSDVEDVLRFLDEFVIRSHEAKEALLLKTLTDMGFPRFFGPVAVVLDDHEAGLSKHRAISVALESRRYEIVAEQGKHFVAHLREHIEKEDRIVFPVAQSLIEHNGSELRHAFLHADTGEIRSGRRGEMLAIVHRLSASYDVAPVRALDELAQQQAGIGD